MTNDQTRERARIEYEYGINQARAAHGQFKHWIEYCIEQLIIIGFPKEHISAKINYDLPGSASYIREICANYGCTNPAFVNHGDDEEFGDEDAEQGGIAPKAGGQRPNFNNNSVFGQNKPIKTQTPVARPNRLCDAWRSAAKACERMAEITEKFPPQIGLEENTLAQAVLDFFEVVAPTPDLKWSKCLPDWYKIELDNVIHGKHAAGAINATVTADGQRRKITREQVGERYDVIFEHALAFVNAIPLLKISIQYYRQKYVDPAVATRKIELAPKLSDQA